MFDFVRNLWNNARRGVGIVVTLLVGLAILPFVMKAVFNGLTSFGLGGDWATIIIVSLIAIFGFALWGNLTGVPELGRPASATWGQITRFAPWAIIVALVVFGWGKFSSETGLGRKIDAEIRDQSAIWNTEAEIANFRADTRTHTRQVVAVRDTPIYIATNKYGFVKTRETIRRGTVVLINVEDSRDVNFDGDGKPIIRHGTLTLVAVRPFDDDHASPDFVNGADLAPAGHAPILEPVNNRSETAVRDSDGIREFYLSLGPGEESRVFGGVKTHVNVKSMDEREFCIKVLGKPKACKNMSLNPSDKFYVIAGNEGVRLRVTEITSR
jgi:hypothetical protein